LQNRVGDRRYSQLVDRFLNANTLDESREILVDFIYFSTGEGRYKEISYIGETFICPITQDTVSNNNKVLILPCGHKGIYMPMKIWIDKNSTCPVCRREL